MVRGRQLRTQRYVDLYSFFYWFLNLKKYKKKGKHMENQKAKLQNWKKTEAK